MTYRYLTDLAAVLRDAGLTVIELDGWRSNGRPKTTGGFDPVGILWHHTGGTPNTRAYADWMANTGRVDLPAPLSQLSIDRAGRWYVQAAGRANHAGSAKASGPVPAGDGNALYLGVECMNTGSEGWTPEQRDSMVRGGAALSEHYGYPAAANRAHKETSSTGKWDPGLLDMDRFRADISARMNEEITVRPVDFLRYKLFGKKQGSRTVADVLREDNANLRRIAEAVARLEQRPPCNCAGSDTPAPK